MDESFHSVLKMTNTQNNDNTMPMKVYFSIYFAIETVSQHETHLDCPEGSPGTRLHVKAA